MDVEKTKSAPTVIVFASFHMPKTVLDQEETDIKWLGTPRVNIEAVTNKI